MNPENRIEFCRSVSMFPHPHIAQPIYKCFQYFVCGNKSHQRAGLESGNPLETFSPLVRNTCQLASAYSSLPRLASACLGCVALAVLPQLCFLSCAAAACHSCVAAACLSLPQLANQYKARHTPHTQGSSLQRSTNRNSLMVW